MERLKALIGRKESKVEFIGDLITLLLTDNNVYSDELLFRDAVEEIYNTLRSEVIDNGRIELVGAYEKAVLLRAVVSGDIKSPEEVLIDIRKNLRVVK
ncbi:hypothetical protein E3E35_05845 [Thermococcus sp. GR7]|uniref:hypothetical protein n=1 Tax=unclassified Thermococcus TaxID=2627626 RepID=UPI001431E3A1|nr:MULTISPECIES: hypothetical protein [unclassified Thermococcus]NJE46938.1 hypothetical protein [Thermococcus sp. GR7]NJE78435.1 hypothetical protein [Thermococcus sp. GR4]NJF23268.1 hypothetical protein [Thermococcus sp. GR5]